MKRFKLDFSFVLLLCIISLSPKQDILLKVLVCLLLHEIGHLFFIFLFQYKIESLKLSIFGFFLKLENTKEEFYKDVFIYSGGLLFNLMAYVIFPDEVMKKINLILIIFNSLPIYPLDGFNIFKTIFSYFFPYRIVLKMMSICSLCSSLGAIILSVYYKMDLYILFNMCYLLLFSIEFYRKEELFYKKFLLDKKIYKRKYPVKTIRFHTHFSLYFYKYHTIQMALGNKLIREEELFETKNSFSSIF